MLLSDRIVESRRIEISPIQRQALRTGDLVQIRSHDEILATLDASGALDGLPFMPEMVRFCGEEHRVFKVAHKTCDEHQLRSINDAVHLEGLRCDGHAHGQCGNGCLLYWKARWLRRIDGPSDARSQSSVSSQDGAAASQMRGDKFVCQATELAKAPPLSKWHVSQYWQDLCSGNVGPKNICHSLRYVLTVMTLPRGTAKRATPCDDLKLQPGDLVQVRTKAEIMKTLDANYANRGLQFVPEMFHFCGKQFRVLQRIRTRIDPDTGKLMELKNACVLLEGVTCRGGLVFCPRANYLFWREAWLKRIP